MEPLQRRGFFAALAGIAGGTAAVVKTQRGAPAARMLPWEALHGREGEARYIVVMAMRHLGLLAVDDAPAAQEMAYGLWKLRDMLDHYRSVGRSVSREELICNLALRLKPHKVLAA